MFTKQIFDRLFFNHFENAVFITIRTLFANEGKIATN